MREEGTLVRVRDVMKSSFDLIDGKTTVEDVLKTMKHVETKSLIVDKHHDGDEYAWCYCQITNYMSQ